MHTAVSQTSGASVATNFSQTLTGKIVIGLAATLVVAAAAHVSIPLWFTPVPLTLQPLAVLGVGLALGPIAGFLTMIAYLAEGALGLPVFSPTGPGGMAQILGHTGGYLMAYPMVAFICGAVTRGIQKVAPRFVAALIGCVAAAVVLFTCGAGWLMTAWHLSAQQAWTVAVAPFMLSEAARIIVAAGTYNAFGRARRS